MKSISKKLVGLSFAILAYPILSPAAQKAKPASKPAPPTVLVSVDATDAPRKIFHAKLTIPASPGTLTVYYPKWIPGEHGPTGPIQDLTGLKFTANGQTLTWRRDLLDGWTFHIEVPSGVASVEASLDFASPAGAEGVYTAGASATDKLTILAWNTVVLYPQGWTSDELQFEASLKIPDGWKFATALPVASASGSEIKFKPASFTTLVDSPLSTGEFMRVFALAPNPPQELDIMADSAAALNVPTDVLNPYRELANQAQKLFGTRHFRDYHFLYTLSDHVAHFGLEHHESNDSRLGERYLVDPDLRLLGAGLLPHEYVHSWNGKFRRPADLATPDYQKPMQDDLLWVYEGLTSYLGDMLSGRSGIRTPEQYRDNLARIAADLDHRSGRTWRNLQDTADGVPSMQDAPHAWQSWRRPLDYYEEDVLNWLWVDTIIRQQTQGAKSLDDFCQIFHGGPNNGPELKTYTLDDVVNTLNQVAPFDWRGFWTERLTNHGPGAPLSGLENSGWKLVYDDKPSPLSYEWEEEHKEIDARFSIGLWLSWDGMIVDTVEGMPAANAGIGPGMKIVAVNGRKMTKHVFHDALQATKTSPEPLELIVENTDYFKVYKLDYHGGEKYPHLVRDNSKPDVLSEIIKAK
jgi:predicted metalloprotease with PDZ domain